MTLRLFYLAYRWCFTLPCIYTWNILFFANNNQNTNQNKLGVLLFGVPVARFPVSDSLSIDDTMSALQPHVHASRGGGGRAEGRPN